MKFKQLTNKKILCPVLGGAGAIVTTVAVAVPVAVSQKKQANTNKEIAQATEVGVAQTTTGSPQTSGGTSAVQEEVSSVYNDDNVISAQFALDKEAVDKFDVESFVLQGNLGSSEWRAQRTTDEIKKPFEFTVDPVTKIHVKITSWLVNDQVGTINYDVEVSKGGYSKRFGKVIDGFIGKATDAGQLILAKQALIADYRTKVFVPTEEQIMADKFLTPAYREYMDNFKKIDDKINSLENMQQLNYFKERIVRIFENYKAHLDQVVSLATIAKRDTTYAMNFFAEKFRIGAGARVSDAFIAEGKYIRTASSAVGIARQFPLWDRYINQAETAANVKINAEIITGEHGEKLIRLTFRSNANPNYITTKLITLVQL